MYSYVGRCPSAATSTGNKYTHQLELFELLSDAFGCETDPERPKVPTFTKIVNESSQNSKIDEVSDK